MVKVSIYDLTVQQIEAIEMAVGIPMSRWREAPSQAALYAQVLATATGEDIETYRSMTIRDLIASVDVGDADPNP